MDYYNLGFDEFSQKADITFTRVEDVEELNKRISSEICDHIIQKNGQNEQVTAIFPVGPLDYSYLADECNKRELDLSNLWVFMMDEYIGPNGELISEDHPLSFRRFMKETFVENLAEERNFGMDKITFPDPNNPEQTSQEILDMDGVQVCYGGFGITGHFAFNDPPEPGSGKGLNWLKNTTTRNLTISRESTTQMVMGGTYGNWDLVPERAVTLGMKELLASDKIHLTFMRDWHAGVLRRALFGPVSEQCPGSLMQEHPNVEVTLTELASEKPMYDVSQETGE